MFISVYILCLKYRYYIRKIKHDPSGQNIKLSAQVGQNCSPIRHIMIYFIAILNLHVAKMTADKFKLNPT